MYDGNTVGVVIPVYNEATFVGDVITTVPSFVDRVYVVDDCSTDGSWETITRHADRTIGEEPEAEPTANIDLLADGGAGDEDRIVATRHARNRGRGGAVKTGYRQALADDLDVVVVIDGDGQMDPSVLHRVVEPVTSGEADYAKGNRLVNPGYWRGMSAWRLFGNVVLTMLTKVASGYWRIRDPQNGYTAISAGALEQLRIEDLYEDYGFLNDLLVRLNVHGMRVVDVPIRAVYGDESSGIRYSSFIPNLSKLLLGRFFWRLWMKHVRRAPDRSRTVPAVTFATGMDVQGVTGTVSSLWRVASGPITVPVLETPQTLVAASLLAWMIACLASSVGTDDDDSTPGETGSPPE